MRPKELVDAIHQSDLHCNWLSVKYEIEVKMKDFDDSFKLYVRMRQDSAVWVSATYYAVEVARFLFTPDSVKYMDRRNNKFYVGDYGFISERFMIEADFESLQALILGNGGAYTSSQDERVRTAKDDGKYYLSFLRKGQLRRAIRRDELRKPMDLVVSLWVNPKDFRIAKTSVRDFADDRELIAEYSDFKPACNTSFPYSLSLVAGSPNEHINVKTSVIKLTTDKEVSLSFTIPEKYEPLYQ